MSNVIPPRTPPGVYRHWKGDLYRVLFTAKIASNGFARESMVVYVSLKTGQFNTRHEKEFHEVVNNDDFRTRRFTYVHNNEYDD